MPLHPRLSTRRARALLCSTIALAGPAGCVSTDLSGNVTGTPATATNIRIVQGVSDATNGIDLALNGSLVLSGMPFGVFTPSTQGAYAAEPVAPQLAFYATGTTTAFYNKVASSLAAGAPFTIVTLGRVTAGAGPGATATVLADTTTSANDAALVRVFNTLDYVGDRTGTKVDVFVYSQGTTRPTTPDIASLPFNTPSPYLVKTGTNLVIDVFEAGAASAGRPPLFTGVITGGPQSVRTAILLDPVSTAPSGTAGSVLVLNDQR